MFGLGRNSRWQRKIKFNWLKMYSFHSVAICVFRLVVVENMVSYYFFEHKFILYEWQWMGAEKKWRENVLHFIPPASTFILGFYLFAPSVQGECWWCWWWWWWWCEAVEGKLHYKTSIIKKKYKCSCRSYTTKKPDEILNG